MGTGLCKSVEAEAGAEAGLNLLAGPKLRASLLLPHMYLRGCNLLGSQRSSSWHLS